MNKKTRLLKRLDEIAYSLSKMDTALALIGLGSVGSELDRLDEYSDLDFFVIVKPGSKQRYIESLSWLTAVAPAAYYFRNTPDGYKLLYKDGIFCEFAVFEEAELSTIPFAAGRIVWKAKGVDDAIAVPPPRQASEERPLEWLLGEALTNLYIGLLRDHRGEKVAAMRFIQGFAVDRVIELAERMEESTAVPKDPFSPDRRLEVRVPALQPWLPKFMQGYEKNRQSAREICAYLEGKFSLNQALLDAILELSHKNF